MTHPLILKLNQEKQEFFQLIADMKKHVESWSNDYTIQQKNLDKMIDELGFSRDTGFDYQYTHGKMMVEHLVVSHPCGLVIGIDHRNQSPYPSFSYF